MLALWLSMTYVISYIMASADDCTFCKISAGKDEETEIIFKRDGFTAFRDIKPAARHHYLIIPDEHIPDPKHLDGNHVEIVEKMVSIGKQLIQDREDTLDDIRFGFHWPPFNSVSHLHLHVIYPAADVTRGIFKPNSFWFVTADWVLERLKKMRQTNDSAL
ncbi:hypothetical protein CHS0354_006970 [Potamilus streckersoni]|uniref:Adenosine 5'-monophosphoramidase HINT3 n=1 Tax=Potamilus streckersoni TaxID=2493646 RepID=A0AAE0RWJ9_9BIVA|nr:hypothetical protein CHS0354_006970 [Potamilus streckersoni]